MTTHTSRGGAPRPPRDPRRQPTQLATPRPGATTLTDTLLLAATSALLGAVGLLLAGAWAGWW